MRNQSHNFHNVFIYNTQLLDPSPFLHVLFLLVLYFILFFLEGMCPIYGLHPIWLFDHIEFSTLHPFPGCLVFNLLSNMEVHKHYNLFNSFNLNPLNTTWCGHIGDKEEYPIVLGDIHMCHQNMLKNILFDTDKIY
jgi:hypothetical protein